MKENILPINKIALVGCSDGNKNQYRNYVQKLLNILDEIKVGYKITESVYADKNNNTKDAIVRAWDLTQSFCDSTVDAVFDITGGDACKEILSYVDWNLIKENRKPFFAYSDNSVIINPLHENCGIPCFYYQLKTISDDKQNRKRFEQFIKCTNDDEGLKSDLFKFNYDFLQGEKLKGKCITGGNIRCTLKLFDTDFKPDFTDKVLFLEAYGGTLESIGEYFIQLKNDGAFEKCSSVLLGNFSSINKENKMNELYKMALEIIDNKKLPVARTMDLGHQSDARCLNYDLSFI